MSLGTSGPPRRPLESIPARRRGSVRRTMHVDVGARTEWGVALPIVGVARDLQTGPDGSVTVLAEARVAAAFDPERRMVEVSSDPTVGWLDDLVGTRAGGGFRRRLDEVVPEAEAGSLVRQVLDDMPAGVLISGYAFMRLARRQGLAPSSLTPPNVLDRMVDLCSGWRAGGVAADSIGSGHGVPMQDCPPAPELTGELRADELRTDELRADGLRTDELRTGELGTDDLGTDDRPDNGAGRAEPGGDGHGTGSPGRPDPLAWHDAAPLPPDHMRRRRCLDVAPDSEGNLTIWAMFRDTVGELDGSESVLHEYAVHARCEDGVLTELVAEPRVLPFPECPGAAGHVMALAGTKVGDLPTAVPELLTGIASCTHLNDLLRALGGLAGLLPLVAAPA